MPVSTPILLAAELLVYFLVMSGLFRLRHRFGLGLFIAALGTMHFLETYLAAIFYVRFVFETQISPGSTVLFAGKLVMLLLVYIREDAATVRQPIYGILIGNFLTVGFVMLLRQQEVVVSPGRSPDFAFLNEMGGLMVWGTLLLFVDAILIILLYEKLAVWLGRRIVARIVISAALVLTFDQLGFYAALHLLLGLPPQVLLGGWLAKMAAAIGYGVLTGLYLRFMERVRDEGRPKRLWDIFDVLTYRERYNALLETSGRDALTDVHDRNRFEQDGRGYVAQALAAGPVSLMLVDLDHFKRINDTCGHTAGDKTLRAVADALKRHLRASDRIFRYGGDEFVICCAGLGAPTAMALAERLRLEVAALALPEIAGCSVTVSIGIASGPGDGGNLDDLFAAADSRLYHGKKRGRDRVIAATEPPIEVIPISAA